MSIEEFIVGLKKLHIGVQLVNGQLKIDAPKGTLNPDIIQEIKEKKEQLVLFLEGVNNTSIDDSVIKAIEKKEYYRTSLIQQRMFIVNELAGDDTPYNLAQSCILEGNMDKVKMQEAVNNLVLRHEAFRTYFRLVNDELKQLVNENVEVKIQFDVGDESEKEKILKEFIKPFDLTNPPLLRIKVASFSEEKHLILIDTHHIVSDGSSGEIFLRDLSKLLNDESLIPLRIQFKEYVEWQYSKEAKKIISRQKNYWLEKYNEEIPTLNLHTDYKRGDAQSFEGNYIVYKFDSNITHSILELIKQEEVTLFIFLLATINILLSKYSNQEDIIIGSPVSGRKVKDLQSVLGVFINALPMRNFPKNNCKFQDFLRQVKNNTLSAYENQEYQLGDLLDELKIETNQNRNPLFDVELILQNYEMTNIQIDNLNIIPQIINQNVSQVDMAFFVTQFKDVIKINLNYCTKLFSENTMYQFLDNWEIIIEQIVNNNNIQLSEIELTKTYKEIETNFLIDEDDSFNF